MLGIGRAPASGDKYNVAITTLHADFEGHGLAGCEKNLIQFVLQAADEEIFALTEK